MIGWKTIGNFLSRSQGLMTTSLKQALKTAWSSEKNCCIKWREVCWIHWWYKERAAKWCEKYLHQPKYVVWVKCVEGMVRRKRLSFGNRGTRSGWTKQMITREILRRSEKQIWSSGTSSTRIFSCLLLITNHAVFLVKSGINLHWVFQKAEIALAEVGRGISVLWRTHFC